MQTLLKTISFLISSHHTVSVEGLGVFVSTYHSAIYFEEAVTFHPPRFEVKFLPDTVDESYSISQIYALKYGISMAEAQSQVCAAVKELKSSLRSGAEVLLGNHGFLKRNTQGSISFILNDRFTDVALPEINLKEIDVPSVSPVIEPETQNYESTGIKTQKNYYHFKIRKGIAELSAAAILMLVFTLSFFLLPARIAESQSKAIAEISPLVFESVNKADKIEKEETTQEELAEVSHKFFLIVATFHSESEANKFISEYKGNPQDLILVPSKRVTRIGIDSSGDREYLQARLNSFEIRSKFPSAWIWEAN